MNSYDKWFQIDDDVQDDIYPAMIKIVETLCWVQSIVLTMVEIQFYEKLCSSFFCWSFNNQIAKSQFKKFDYMFMVWELSYLCNLQVHHWTKVAQGLEQDWSWMAICVTALLHWTRQKSHKWKMFLNFT